VAQGEGAGSEPASSWVRRPPRAFGERALETTSLYASLSRLVMLQQPARKVRFRQLAGTKGHVGLRGEENLIGADGARMAGITPCTDRPGAVSPLSIRE